AARPNRQRCNGPAGESQRTANEREFPNSSRFAPTIGQRDHASNSPCAASSRSRTESLPILPWNPKDVGGAVVVHCAARDEKKARETVDVFESRRRNVFARFVPELDDDTLGAPTDCSCEMQ